MQQRQTILRLFKKCESAGVGQPLNLAPPASLNLIQVELLRRRLRLVQIQGASLAFFTLFEQSQYIQKIKNESLMFPSVNPSFFVTPASFLAANNFLKTLECPVMITPLTDAVMLRPCGHTISEIAAKNIYHGMRNVNDSKTVKNQAPCPLCRHEVTAYYPNQIMRSVVEMVLSIGLEKVLPIASATVEAEKEKNLDAIPFPGLGAKFVLASEGQSIVNSGTKPVGQLPFVSQTQKSLFEKMTVLRYKDGRVAISLDFKGNPQAASNYLSECGINISPADRNYGFYTSDESDNELLFRIITKHNEIPADKFSIIRDLVISGHGVVAYRK